ncbi:large ribosomal RNA subunit accumulation protein YCED homolog 1, chloroplastic isoform X1 [Vigna umbellata]|uniref:large ribosomal RNA subunit accumulation protein YCED homolog 1, chloroplastic isoform X1 n=1 Tax=Vigna umbellata TaxID=87088 RepID=UPI001F5ED46F|nr:large ribosomal RNA subunit accumulation protein YCED homolog 1, chloroplastic isoform X1 [Vigna umbellata]XP_047171515.1 large ribosomal RNA subunit accumulation protein YCED homolog 1, chloroplastic isoform X1 [Vigna umbellata]
MSLVIPSSSAVPLHFSKLEINSLSSYQKFASNFFIPFNHEVGFCCKPRHFGLHVRNEPNVLHKYTVRSKGFDFESIDNETLGFDDDDVEDMGSPWEGAVVYKRNASILHLEYCTTLERLGLAKLSTDLSKTRAAAMGLRVTKAVKDFPNGTPVQISVDVTRKKKKLRLDGIIKTVITLLCNRCCMPSAESIFSEFSLLLTDEPIEEPETIDMGVIFGEEKLTNGGKDDEDDALIDLEDQLYFPSLDNQIDISKNIRDRVHLEITMNSVCDPGCKGMCLKCGQNFNTGNCSCSKEEVKEKSYGPLGDLKEKMQL